MHPTVFATHGHGFAIRGKKPPPQPFPGRVTTAVGSPARRLSLFSLFVVNNNNKNSVYFNSDMANRAAAAVKVGLWALSKLHLDLGYALGNVQPPSR